MKFCIDDIRHLQQDFSLIYTTASYYGTCSTLSTVIHHMQVVCDNFMLHCIVSTFHTILQLVILCENTCEKAASHIYTFHQVF